MKKLLSTFLVVLSVALCLSACTNGKGSNTATENMENISSSVLFTLSGDSGREVVLIYPQSSKAIGNACKEFSQKSAEATGADMTRRDDKFPYEGDAAVILVGEVNDSRAEGMSKHLWEDTCPLPLTTTHQRRGQTF